MKNLVLSFALVAFGVGAPVILSAAETTSDSQGTTSFNTTCPVCVKPVDAGTKTVPYKASAGGKAQHPEMSGNVGFCSDTCRTEFQKNPSKYENTLYPQYTQWQESKNTRVK